MTACRRRGFTVQAFKIGPGKSHHSLTMVQFVRQAEAATKPALTADFLDPLHHEAATGRPSINLDGWMLNKEQNLASFHRHAADADICIVEGVMGLFDGRDGMTEAGSTAELAKWLGAPVLLVMDCWSMARSAAAMVKGYQEFDPDLNLAGVIFNKVGSSAHSQWLSEAVQSTGVTTKVFGGVPKVHKLHPVQCLEDKTALSLIACMFNPLTVKAHHVVHVFSLYSKNSNHLQSHSAWPYSSLLSSAG